MSGSFCSFERQLKAATVPIFAHEPQLARSNVPNTNQHAVEGSNPMWMTGYDNQWYKDEERLSESSSSSSSNNSLDENALATAVDDLHFSSLDTLEPHHHHHHNDHGDRESSGHSSSSTTNDRSVLCRSSNAGPSNTTATTATRSNLARGGCVTTATVNNYATAGQRRQAVPPPPIPNNPPPPGPMVKKTLAPKPPQPPNVIVISQTSTKTDTIQRNAALAPNGTLRSAFVTKSNVTNGGTFTPGSSSSATAAKSPCVNNIYIETFSNHHKSSGKINGNQQMAIASTSNGHYPSEVHSSAGSSTSSNPHAHYHHYHHHHHPQQVVGHQPTQFGGVVGGGGGMSSGLLGGPGGGGGAGVAHYHRAHEAQLMNLETTEL